MEIDRRLIEEIISRILLVTQPSGIILFGSAAEGKIDSDSDIDLLVLRDKPSETRRESIKIGNALRGLGYAFDVIVMKTDRFEESKNTIGGIAYPANKYGKIIYEAA